MSELDPPDDDFDALAGEFVLGLLDAEGLARVAAARARDGDTFESALRNWEARLMPMAEALPPVTPPARLWAAIEAAVADPKRAPGGIWNSLNFWRYFGIGAAAVGVAALAVALLARTPQPAPNAVATLSLKTGGAFIATAAPIGGGMMMVVSPANVTVPQQKSDELWLIVPNRPPHALGVLPSGAPEIVNVSAAEIGGDPAAVELAVSLEPPGGSPTGLPTGPVIGASKFSAF